MPDKRTHRGPHPEDAQLFTAEALPTLRKAVAEMSWLLSRGYADTSTLKLVGDRYALTRRQRLAVMRASCSDSQLENRRRKLVSPEEAKLQPLMIDGYNLLITIEAALSNGPLFLCRDGCVRDLASIHGTYRKVEETIPAIGIIADALNKLKISEAIWLLDQPVSNSGRLKRMILDFALNNQRGHSPPYKWDVRLVQNPDKELAETEAIIATSDSAVIDKCQKCLNLTRIIIETISPEYDLNLLDLTTGSAGVPPA